MSINYLTLAEILVIHQEQIQQYGGKKGIRDKGALVSAIMRPQSGYYQGILQEAAAFWESLSQNHPFIDGNKRVALDATLTFLALNNYYLHTTEENLWGFLNNLYSNNNFEYKYLLDFLNTHCEKY
jgi:death-on-curing protein